MDKIRAIEHEQMKNVVPKLKVGNTVKVHVRITEGNKPNIYSKKNILWCRC